jgi:hypothetical protein
MHGITDPYYWMTCLLYNVNVIGKMTLDLGQYQDLRLDY